MAQGAYSRIVNPIEPKRSQFLLTEHVENVIFAIDQPGYIPLPSLRTPDGRVVSQWMPDANELEMIKSGVPITVISHTFGHPLQGLQVGVGGTDLR